MAKAQKGKTVYALFRCGLYYDGGDELKSLHETRAGANAARKKLEAGKEYAGLGFEIEKFELED